MANQEILRESDKTTLQAHEQDNDTVFEKIAREAYVIGAGTVGGAVKEGWRQAVEDPWGSAARLGTAVTLGVALGYAQRGAGMMRLGGQAVGAALGISFMADVMAPRRWGEIRSTLADTWQSDKNMDRNLKVMEHNLGRFGFDTAMMLGGTMAGARLGQGLHGRISALDGKLMGESPMSLRMQEIAPSQFTGRRFEAKAGETTPWEMADGILKSKKSYGLHELGEFQANMLVAKDGPALELKGQVKNITEQGTVLKGEVTQLSQQVTARRLELKQAQELVTETQAVTRAKTEVQRILEAKAELPAREARLKELEAQIKQQNDAKKGGEGEGHKKGKGAKAESTESAGVDLKAEARELREQINRTKQEVNEADPTSALNRARARQFEAEQALKAAEEAKPAKVQELETSLTQLEEALKAKQEAHQGLGEQLRQAITAYEARVNQLKADNGVFVQASEAQLSAATARPVREVRSQGSGERAVRTEKPAETGKTEVKQDKAAERAPEVAKTPEVIAAEKAQSALKEAQEITRERVEKDQMREQAKKLKQEVILERKEIDSGKKTFETEQAKQEALEALKVKEAAADKLRLEAGKPQYHRPLSAVNEYAKAAENYLAAETNGAKRDAFVKEAVANVEAMMQTIPNAFRGTSHGERGIPQNSRGIQPEKRLAQLREHLDTRLADIDAKHSRKVGEVMEQPLVTEAFGKVNSGQIRQMMLELAEGTVSQNIPRAQRERVVADAAKALYENSTIAFFEKGKLVQNQGTDGRLHQQLFDVARVERGQGRPDRLIGHTVDGYALVVPKLRTDGKLMEIRRRGNNPGRGGRADQPTFAKEVFEVAGAVPEGVTRGTSLGRLFLDFKGAPEVKAQGQSAGAAEIAATAKPQAEALTEVGPTSPEAVSRLPQWEKKGEIGGASSYEAVAPKVETKPVDTTGEATTGKLETGPESGN